MKNLQPQAVWNHFHSLTQIPRPSGKKEEVTAFLAEFGRSLGLETIVDSMGNVIIRKPASPGYENHPGVILQGHSDMVPQKNNDTVFDFEKDPIEAYIDGEWVTAKGTTLGADNGIGVAAAMAILADKNAVHPPLEMLVTVDEETGMYGAFALEGGMLQGKTLLNLDSEAEGELYVGCAGGVDTTAKFAYTPVEVEEGDVALKVSITGCKGGHSGCDIHLQRANANKLLFRFLKDAVANLEARLASVEGGSLRNAIPREASAIITVPAEGVDEVMDLVAEYEDLFVTEYDGVEDNIRFSAEEVTCPATVELTLVKDKKYKVAFWAQNKACSAYDVDKEAMTVTVDYASIKENNDEKRDAFFKTVDVTVKGSTSIDVELKRALAQINVGVTAEDWEAAKKAGATGGTVIRARKASTEKTGDLGDLQTQDEKEIITTIQNFFNDNK